MNPRLTRALGDPFGTNSVARPLEGRVSTQIEGSVLIPITSRIQADVRGSFGRATVTKRFDLFLPNGRTTGHLDADVTFIGTAISGRLYPLEKARVSPWVSAGVEASLVRLKNPVVFTSRAQTNLAEDESSTLGRSFLRIGSGIDIQITKEHTLGFSGDYAVGFGWRVGLSIGFRSSRPQPAFNCSNLRERYTAKLERIELTRRRIAELKGTIQDSTLNQTVPKSGAIHDTDLAQRIAALERFQAKVEFERDELFSAIQNQCKGR